MHLETIKCYCLYAWETLINSTQNKHLFLVKTAFSWLFIESAEELVSVFKACQKEASPLDK